MSKLYVSKEVAVDKETIKVMIGDTCIARSQKVESSVDIIPNGKPIYMQGLFLKTNKILLPKDEVTLKLLWKQNYLFVVILVLLILFFAFKILVIDESYTTTDRIVLLLGGGIAIKLLWNDLLILGRKIRIEK